MSFSSLKPIYSERSSRTGQDGSSREEANGEAKGLGNKEIFPSQIFFYQYGLPDAPAVIFSTCFCQVDEQSGIRGL